MDSSERSQAVWRTESGRRPDSAAGWRLFMADSRSSREFRDEYQVETALILGRQQTDELEAWLRDAPAQDLKIVTSAAMLLPRTRFHLEEPLYQDDWQGYPASLRSLLALLCDHQVRNVVFLSGDAHLACSAEITVKHHASGNACVFHSHHAPPLYAPYPFANEIRQNLVLRDRFEFELEDAAGARSYECIVKGEVPTETRQGYGLLHADHDGSAWTLRTEIVDSR